MRVKDKIAIVTGGTGEMGAAIARRLVAEGAQVLLCGRRDEEGQRIAREIDPSGMRAAFVRADLSLEEDCLRVVEATRETFGGVDVLINNAAPTESAKQGDEAPITQQTTAQFDYIMKVGLYGPMWLSRFAIPEMSRRGGGAIINISSWASVRGIPALPGYCTAKAALEGLTRQIAVDFAKDCIRCVGIRLGAVESTEKLRMAMHHPVAGPAIRQSMLTRPGTPDDVAGLVLYLASDEAQIATGAIWPFENGMETVSKLPDMGAAFRDADGGVEG